MAGKNQVKNQDVKTNQVVDAENTEAKIKVIAQSKSGAGTTLKVKIDDKQEEIIHGEILEVSEKELQKLKIASSSWSYEEVKGDKK